MTITGASRVPRSQPSSGASIRCGIINGNRVWIRNRRRCGMAASRSARSANTESTSTSGSPPLRITSCSELVGRDRVNGRLPGGERGGIRPQAFHWQTSLASGTHRILRSGV